MDHLGRQGDRAGIQTIGLVDRLARGDARDVEQIVHHARLVAELAGQHRKRFAPGRGGRSGVVGGGDPTGRGPLELGEHVDRAEQERLAREEKSNEARKRTLERGSLPSP